MADSVEEVKSAQSTPQQPPMESGASSTTPEATPDALAQPVTCLGSVGPERAKLLARLGIQTVGDLLHHVPRTYEDRRSYRAIQDLDPGSFAVVQGKIVDCGTRRARHGGRFTFEFILDDGTARLHCRWWNVAYVERLVRLGDELVVWGKVRSDRPRRMDHPEFEKVDALAVSAQTTERAASSRVHLGRLVPVYPLTEGLSQRQLREWVNRVLESFLHEIQEPQPALIPTSSISQIASLANQHCWPSRQQAFKDLHFPTDLADADKARQRLALDEFVALQFNIQRRRRSLQTRALAMPCPGDNRWMQPFLAGLPFQLTAAQRRVLKEIRQDLSRTIPMRRLLQGDVGSGKTLVAAAAALMTLESGHDVAIMAPTEVLATQLYQTFQTWLSPFAIPVLQHTGSQKNTPGPTEPPSLFSHPTTPPTAPSTSSTSSTPPSTPTVFIGTHALIYDSFNPNRLGLVVIDEQHRFGVVQRETLLRKGNYPHLLVMTATPIPRTLGLVLYGDLDVSVLDELPSGRGRIRTHLRSLKALPKVIAFIRDRIEAGEQIYVVCPRIQETPGNEVQSVLHEWKRFSKALAPHSVGLLHGQLPTAERQDIMQAFRQGHLKALVSTTLIEVGVDVPNATVMIIQNAEQFGLAQLHQLRGRIGRGTQESHCILLTSSDEATGTERLEVLKRTTDGFELAEADLQLRGAGDLIGRTQSGESPFRFGDLLRDQALIETARSWVCDYLNQPEGAERKRPGADFRQIRNDVSEGRVLSKHDVQGMWEILRDE